MPTYDGHMVQAIRMIYSQRWSQELLLVVDRDTANHSVDGENFVRILENQYKMAYAFLIFVGVDGYSDGERPYMSRDWIYNGGRPPLRLPAFSNHSSSPHVLDPLLIEVIVDNWIQETERSGHAKFCVREAFGRNYLGRMIHAAGRGWRREVEMYGSVWAEKVRIAYRMWSADREGCWGSIEMRS